MEGRPQQHSVYTECERQTHKTYNIDVCNAATINIYIYVILSARVASYRITYSHIRQKILRRAEILLYIYIYIYAEESAQRGADISRIEIKFNVNEKTKKKRTCACVCICVSNGDVIPCLTVCGYVCVTF